MAMTATRSCIATLAFALVPYGVASGQKAPAERSKARVTLSFAEMRVAEWTAAVRTHATGTVDDAVRAVAPWKREHVTLVLRLALPKANADTLQRALSLHTDIAIAERKALLGPPVATATRRDAVVLIDGRESRLLRRSFHWEMGWQVASALAALPGESPRAAEWYRAVAAQMQQWGDYDVVTGHLQSGLALFPNDARLALYQGTLHQTLGDPRLHGYLRQRAAPAVAASGAIDRPPPSELRPLPPAARIELEAAERQFGRALTIDPTLVEARIRLAHVLSVLGDDRGAAETVRPALEATLTPFFEYYAALILGRSEEHLGRFAEADDAYARAGSRFPTAQPPRIGRSRVALARGRAAEALTSLAATTAPGLSSPPDPWLTYFREHEPSGTALLAAWRTPLRTSP